MFGSIVDPASEAVIDESLLLCMGSPKSYTREDVIELHCHGGPVVRPGGPNPTPYEHNQHNPLT